tara:strand:- start:795651 stop:796127 length:477 start_codon:yes stop_codon:yes gene_type:complete
MSMSKLEVLPEAVLNAALNANPYVQEINAIMGSGQELDQVDALLDRMDKKLTQTNDNLREQSYPKSDATVMRTHFDATAANAEQTIGKIHDVEVGLVYLHGVVSDNDADEQSSRLNAVVQGARLADTERGFCPTLSTLLENKRQEGFSADSKNNITIV